ncbi:PIN domain-containing protein [Corallococcus exercitus]|uniref:PIN domain-containing protein n=1 Tax=Corallococcus exercitus TaxID=2316736 RepID=UPI0035D4FCA2
MIVYIESNFILELALGQEGAAAAESILSGAEQRLFELVIPAFSLSEPFGTLAHRGRERKKIGNQLEEQFRQLRRSRQHQATIQPFETAPAVLLGLETAESDALDSVVMRSLRTASRIELTIEMFEQALNYRRDYDLSSSDAIIYASVVADARKRERIRPKLFVSRNHKDFDIPQVHDELGSLGAEYCDSFERTVEKLAQHNVKLPRPSVLPIPGVA